MKKRLISVCLLLLLSVALLPVSAYAEDFEGSSDWKVTFTPETEMKSNFTNSQISDAIATMQPGDSVHFSIVLQNQHANVTDWYMTNKVVESMEDYSKNAQTSGGAYTYRLTYTGPDGKVDELFNSETVGGEGGNSAGEGLHQAADSMKDYFYLDTLSKGQTGTIDLTVGISGFGQTNVYQDTQAELNMNFAVLLNYDSPDNPDPRKVVKTGDENDLGLYAGLTAASGMLVLLLAVYGLVCNRKARKEGRK